MRAILDTDTASHLWRYHHPQAAKRAARYLIQYKRFTFTEFTYYEVLRGLRASRATRQIARFEQFCQQHEFLPFTHQAALRAAEIWADLKQRGQLIGEVDLLIAAIALSEGLAVVTHNTTHFGRVSGLKVIDWLV